MIKRMMAVLVFLISMAGCFGPGQGIKIIREDTFFNNMKGEPANLHPVRYTDFYSSIILSHILESLLQRNKNNYEWEPQLAKKWTVSKDGKIFTFELFEGLKWSDGEPLTAHDVKFSFEAYKNPEYGGIRHLPYYESMDSAVVLSDTKIQFKVKKLYFNNFNIAAGMLVFPRHIYKDPKARLSKTAFGSGPYMLDHYIKGKILILRKNPFWQSRAKTHPVDKNKWLFKNIVFRFVQEEPDILLRMEKGHIDFSRLSPRAFFEKTNRPPWGQSVKKIQYSNKEPSGYDYIGLNLKKPLFQDKRVRKALAHLVHRRLMNEKFQYGQAELARGPWYFWSDFADPSVKPIEFSPKKADQLLKAAGWADRDKNGVLEKTLNGRKTELSFTVLYSNPDGEKDLTLYKEDLKKSGIQLQLKNIDWASFLKVLNDSQFDAIILGWSGGIEIDPKQIWHSDSMRDKGSNRIGYSNPRVDRLIDKGRGQFNRSERIKTFREVYRLIAEDVPYIFLFNRRKKFYGLNQRVKTPAPALNYDKGILYWDFQTGF